MSYLRQCGALLLLLVSLLAPAMACMAPDAQSAAEERTCCRTMHNDCGRLEAPASQGCCNLAPGDFEEDAQRTDALASHSFFAVAAWICALDSLPFHEESDGWAQRPQHSPPQSPPSILSALRV